MAEHDVEQVWHEFWEPIVTQSGLTGSVLDIDQIKRELYDYRQLLKGLPGFFDDVSGGKVTKPNTDLRIVSELIQERALEQYNEGYEDGKADAVYDKWQEAYDKGHEDGRESGIDIGISQARDMIR